MMDMFVKNLAVFTDALGVENAPAIISLSLIPWADETDRNQFITSLTGIDVSRNY